MAELHNERVEIFFQGMEEQPTLRMNATFTDLSVVRLSYHGHSHYNCVVDPKHPPPLGNGVGSEKSIRNARISQKTQEKDALIPLPGSEHRHFRSLSRLASKRSLDLFPLISSLKL